MIIKYDDDVVGWANEQARLIRSGRFELLDIQHIAEEIESVGKSEQRELESRMSVLLAHLLKWQYQPERQSTSWSLTIKTQRRSILRRLEKTPSLKSKLNDITWWSDVWDDAISIAASETGLSDFPEECPWSINEVLTGE